MKISRRDLFDKVWSMPMTKLAAEMDISDVGPAKACRRSAIPLPKAGHWIKAQRGQGVDDIERARERAHNGPALLALIGRVQFGIENVPVHEQWLCIGAGLMNFLNALHLMGFGAKTLSGASIQDPDIQRAFCKEDERLLAWIVVGTPVRATHAKQADDPSGVITTWQE